MDYDRMKASLAPCGLSCEKCFAFVDGDIRRLSLELGERLGNFQAYAKRFETLLAEPTFRNFPQFNEMLEYFALAHCSGCRREQCKMFKDCGVRACHQAKKVDFCFQCPDFPCGKTNFDRNMHRAWIDRNERIRSEGLEKYYENTLQDPRYV